MSEDVPEVDSLVARHRWWLLLVLMLVVAAAVGRWTQVRQQEAARAEAEKSKPTADDKKKDKDGKKKDEPKPDFNTFRLAIQPGEGAATIETAPPKDKDTGKEKDSGKAKEYEAIHLVKPGHWATASLSAQANNYDFTGQLATGASDPQGNWIDLEKSPYRLFVFRPAQLPKGQPKQLEVSWFVPRGSSKSWIASHLRDRRGRSDVKTEMDRLEHMPQYQYYFFVLAREPKQYGYLKVLDTVRPSWGDVASGLEDEDYYYRVLLPRVGNRIPLPAQPLTWTSLAYILWDDVDPKLFRPEQEQALLDWLHWGGQIIISGPRTLDAMRGSFLEPYLPASGGATRELDDAGLKELSDHWTVPGREAPGRPLVAIKPWAAVTLTRHAEASFLPGSGELVAERRVGRGRIVVTAFRLQQRDLLNWRSFDSFFNNVLLRRPPREFIDGRNLKPHVTWRDEPKRRLDSRLVTGIRYFTRDGDPLENRIAPQKVAADEPGKDPFGDEPQVAAPVAPSVIAFSRPNPYGDQYENRSAAPAQQFRYPVDLDPRASTFEQGQENDETTMAKRDSGVGGWSDNSDVAEAARTSLERAAGVEIPQPTFVLKILFAYLIVLVPLNWGVFKLMGKVEWAWIAAPVIAVVCSGLVIKLARLDIGFAQAKTEIAVVEVQPSYTRAHATRYTALYTSLSTTYDVTYTDNTTLAQPFASHAQILPNQVRPIVALGRTGGEEGLKLSGFELSSNSTGMLHSEQMLDLGGALDWQAAAGDGLPQVANRTPLTLHGAAVLRRVSDQDGKPAVETAWIGTFEPSQTATIRFLPSAESKLAVERDASPITAEKAAEETLSLRGLVELAQSGHDMAIGDVRLVAWLEEELPGVTIEPVAAQARHAALLVAHLQYGPLSLPEADKNTRADVRELPKDDDTPDFVEPPPGSPEVSTEIPD